jgi:type II secretory pathway component HofQ
MDDISELEDWYGAKAKKTGFGYIIKVKYATLNVYSTSVEDIELEIVSNIPKVAVDYESRPALQFEKFWGRLLENLKIQL